MTLEMQYAVHASGALIIMCFSLHMPLVTENDPVDPLRDMCFNLHMPLRSPSGFYHVALKRDSGD